MECVRELHLFRARFMSEDFSAALVNAIPPDTHYIGPSVADADGCHCSSVTYSVVSACAGCQQRSYLNWTTWSYNCTVKYEAS